MKLLPAGRIYRAFLCTHALWICSAQAQSPHDDSQPSIVTFTTRQDHQNMMQQLGITKLRPGPSGNPNSPNAANTDESKANPYPHLPDLMTLKDGTKVTTPEQWWKQRRPEIVEDFEREVLGRVPDGVPSVKWELLKKIEKQVGSKDVVEKRLVGRADNSACPEISVNILMSVVTPKAVDAPVPTLMMFGFTTFGPDGEDLDFGGRFRRFGRREGGPPPKTQQLIEAGWGYATISANSIQEDSGGERQRRFGPPRPAGQTGGGLTRGIIGLTNLGQPRKPDQWGSLRAWAWGASRGLDYLETDPSIDANRVGIDGVSRYGKAALVTMAFDQRFATVLVGSSGEGGASLYRRNFGEAVENLTGSGEYHWMAGNFLKYGTAESSFGSMNSSDLPVDSHMLIALCAPRPTFISYGIPERGDALWLDQQGSFMAAIAAQPAFRLLGARDLGRSDDYMTEKMPPVNTDMLSGELAWRQHDGGHTDVPNIPHFIRWMDALWAAHTTEKAARETHRAIERRDPNSQTAHEQLLAKTKQGKIDVYFAGDSITRRWGALDYPKLLQNFRRNFNGWNAANFAWGGDNTHNILWRLQNGELEGVTPKIVVLQAGTNNLPWRRAADDSHIDDVVQGIEAIIDEFQYQTPESQIILTAVFPRTQNMALTPAITKINERLRTLADEKKTRFLNINNKLADSTGKLLPGISSDGLHLDERGYQIWADALKPLFTNIVGPPAKEDHAPPATGDPSVAQRVAPRTSRTSAASTEGRQESSRPTTPGGAEVPQAVRIKRPTDQEVKIAENALARFTESADAQTKAVLESFPSLIEVRVPRPNTAIVPNLARFFRQKHQNNLEVAKEGEAELLFMGDSITDFWRNEDGPFAGKKVFDEYFGHWKVANFGIAGDTTQGVLYRLQNGEGEGISPKAVMLMIGTNNTSRNSAEEIAEGVGAIVLELQKRFADAKILLLGIFPRGRADAPVRDKIRQINQIIAKLHDGQRVFYRDIGQKFLDEGGNIPREIMVDALHPSAKGYEIWAEAVKDSLGQLMEQE